MHDSQVYNPPSTQYDIPSQHLIRCAPQQPPSYNQITRHILGADNVVVRENLPSVRETGNECFPKRASNTIRASGMVKDGSVTLAS